MRYRRFAPVLVVVALAVSSCLAPRQGVPPGAAGLPADVAGVAANRGLSPADVLAAVKTYTPTGKPDEHVMFASGGHSGQVFAIGIPSMRILRSIGVFTPESWQGYGFSDESRNLMEGAKVYGNAVHWGDTHHPALSETNGEYDGQFLFINDKASGRVAVIDLRDWETKQILKNPVINNNHGGGFVTPNTEYLIEGSQYGLPLGGAQADITEYKDKYRGVVTFWKFDRAKGRIDPDQSFAMELPPYWQDLCDAGKLASDGWALCNSFNTELATGKLKPTDANFEAGVSAGDRDYLHVFNWRRAEEVARAGKVNVINGMRVIRLDTAIAEGLLYFVPEPKSPHGVDITPKGDFAVVSGKLDPHVTVYNWQKIFTAIKEKRFVDKDPYGIPILNFDEVMEAQVEVGLGPLHTQFDDKGFAYTSLFLDSAVARWSLGSERPQDGWKLIHKLPVHYNIGHLAAVEGDTVKPQGKYLVALNKWSIDRFVPTGPLHPQNLQLVDIAGEGTAMQLLYDLPMGIGEPHYAVIIRLDRLKTWTTYPEVGFDPATMAKSPFATAPGQERVERRGNEVHVYMTAIRSHFAPEHVEVKQGDTVVWHITSVESTRDATHGFGLPGYDVNLSLEPGETATFTFVANKTGTYSWYCTEFCSALHLEMVGYLQVKP